MLHRNKYIIATYVLFCYFSPAPPVTLQAKDSDARKKELTRLGGMKSGSMKPELKQWLVQRQNILKQVCVCVCVCVTVSLRPLPEYP